MTMKNLYPHPEEGEARLEGSVQMAKVLRDTRLCSLLRMRMKGK
jgi:hypothetical protein